MDGAGGVLTLRGNEGVGADAQGREDQHWKQGVPF